jgi:magnesium-transporting ATPase (P-type)
MKHPETRVLSPRLTADDPAVRRVARAPNPRARLSRISPQRDGSSPRSKSSGSGEPPTPPRRCASEDEANRARGKRREPRLGRVRAKRPSRPLPQLSLLPSLTLSVSDDLDERRRRVKKTTLREKTSKTNAFSFSSTHSFPWIKRGKRRSGCFRSNEITTSHYTARNFLFKNLFQQFQRAANVYFLVIGCLQLDVFFPGLSPTHWSTTIGPLLFVLSINAVKEAVDDYGRHKSDAEVNARTVEVVRVAEESPDGKKTSRPRVDGVARFARWRRRQGTRRRRDPR